MPKESRSKASLIPYPVKTLRRFFGLISTAACRGDRWLPLNKADILKTTDP
jgi:hypothetical protein